MSAEANKQIIMRYRAIHNEGKLAELDEIVAQDVISHSALPGLPGGLEGGKLAHQAFLASFPDLQTTTQHVVADGDMVMEHYTAHGTHTAPFMGAPATGKPFEIETYVTYRLANGKIVETWGLNDAMALMTQLGLMPAAEIPTA